MDGGHNLHFDGARTPGPVVAAMSILEAKQGSEQLLIEELGKLVRSNRQPTGSNPFGTHESIMTKHANPSRRDGVRPEAVDPTGDRAPSFRVKLSHTEHNRSSTSQ